jgi:hypothetical protein
MRPAHYLLVALALACGCGWPATRMVPVAWYPARETPTISSAPSYTAGTNYQRTYSPDGATLFVCVNRTTEPGYRVPPGAVPAC